MSIKFDAEIERNGHWARCNWIFVNLREGSHFEKSSVLKDHSFEVKMGHHFCQSQSEAQYQRPLCANVGEY